MGGQRDARCPAAADRRGAHADLPRQHLEPRLRRSIPGRRRAHHRAGTEPREHAERGQPGDPVLRGDGRRGAVDDHPRLPQGALRNQRDHHHADDVVHRRGGGERARQGPLPGPNGQHPADAGDPDRPHAALDPGHAHPRRRARGARGGAVCCVRAQAHLLWPPAARARGQPARGRTRRHQRQAADRDRVLGQRGAGRRGRGRRHPRRVGVHARQLESRLRRHRDPLRIPRAAEPPGVDSVHRLLRGPFQRRRSGAHRTPASRPTSCSCWWR